MKIRIEKPGSVAMLFVMTENLKQLRLFFAFTAFVSLISATALAQKCTEQFVKDSPMPTPFETKAPDVYFFPGIADKPIVGAQQWKNWSENEQKTTTRKNSSGSCKKDRVVAAPSGEMAYAYGTCGSTFDEADGKHQDLILAFLEVWKVVDGTCKLAARQIHAEGGE